jgi:hypothetical protein
MSQGNVAHLSMDPTNGKWKATYQGQVLAESPDRNYIVKTIEKGLNKTAKACGVTHCVELNSSTMGQLLSTGGLDLPPKPEFSITERFEFLEETTQMVIDGDINAGLVTGEGGLGKTHTVLEQINLRGLTYTHQFQPPPEVKKEKKEAGSDDGEEGNGDEDDEIEIVWQNPGQVHIVKGYSSAKGLYRCLFENNGKIIIFDDCDSIQRDANAVNILKGALDTSDERWVSWNAETGRGLNKLPLSFQFTGRVIFISNWALNRCDTALKTRCAKVDLSMTADEKLERMDYIIHRDSFMPDIAMDVKEDALSFLEEHKEDATNLSLRSLSEAIKYRNRNKPNWKRHALYSLTAGD